MNTNTTTTIVYHTRTDTQNYTPMDILNEIKEDVEILVKLGYVSMQNNHYSANYIPRSTHVLGRCRYMGPNYYQISVSLPYLKECKDPTKVHNTIMHEVIHSVPGCMNHGNSWKSVGRRVTQAYPEFGIIQRTSNTPDMAEFRKKNAKYLAVCPSCGLEYSYQRRPKYYGIEGVYRCGKCSTKLIWKTV